MASLARLALTFDDGQVRLLYRIRANTWLVAEEFEFEESSIFFRMESLRDFSRMLVVQSPAIKLYASLEDVRFQRVYPDPGKIAALTPDQIRSFVQLSTSYDPSRHRLDWRKEENAVRVAFVSRQRLADLEGFARRFQFFPTTFSAVQPGIGAGMEFFLGETDLCRKSGYDPAFYGRESEPFRIRSASGRQLAV